MSLHSSQVIGSLGDKDCFFSYLRPYPSPSRDLAQDWKHSDPWSLRVLPFKGRILSYLPVLPQALCKALHATGS